MRHLRIMCTCKHFTSKIYNSFDNKKEKKKMRKRNVSNKGTIHNHTEKSNTELIKLDVIFLKTITTGAVIVLLACVNEATQSFAIAQEWSRLEGNFRITFFFYMGKPAYGPKSNWIFY